MSHGKSHFEEELEVKTRRETRKPPMYRVVLLNDDYTTMDFVVHVLETVFNKSTAEATQIMLHVHKKGSGLAGVYTRDIAETKVAAVHEIAGRNQYPLRCRMEKE